MPLLALSPSVLVPQFASADEPQTKTQVQLPDYVAITPWH
jgi:hypothetical protein